VEYADGFSVYAWQGTEVPAGTVIDVDSLTVERIEAESNGMLRPVLVDLFGRERYLREKRATLTHQEGRLKLPCPRLPCGVHVGRDRNEATTAKRNSAHSDNSPNAPFGVG